MKAIWISLPLGKGSGSAALEVKIKIKTSSVRVKNIVVEKYLKNVNQNLSNSTFSQILGPILVQSNKL